MTPKTSLSVLCKKRYWLLAEELSWRQYDTGENMIDLSGVLQEFK